MTRRSQRAPRGRRHQRRVGLFLLFGVLLALLIVVSPKEPTRQALNITAEGEMRALHEGLVISEVMSANASAYPDTTGKFSDWLELWNTTDAPMDLQGVSLSNRSDRARFIFPHFILPPDGRVVVICDGFNQNDPDRPFHAKFKLASLGVSVFLFDTAGHVMDTVTVPTLNSNEVYALMPDGFWEKSDYYSPGFVNGLEGHQQYLAAYQVETGQIIINELMAAARSGLRDEDGDLSDWIELKNVGTTDFDLGQLAISDNPDRPIKWVFPEGAIIPAGGYYVVFASGKDRVNDAGFPHTNFSLAAEGETVVLHTRHGQMLDRVQYSMLPVDQSYGRDPATGEWRVFTIGTPGAPNDQQGSITADRFLRRLNTSGVIITEMMSSNDAVTPVAGRPPSDWVELYNTKDSPYDLSGHGLSDSITWPRKWRFPSGSVIYPGEYKVIIMDKTLTPPTLGDLRTSYALKRAGGEVVTFSDPDGNVLDRVVMPPIPLNISYGRSGDLDGLFYFYDEPTPGTINGPGFAGFAHTPNASHPGGLYEENIQVTLSAARPGERVRYTTDGSIPTIDKGMDYTGPIEIKDTTVIRARSFQAGLQPSETITHTYVMKTYYTMPVVCLTMDPEQLWDPYIGIYAAGVHEDGTPIDLAAYSGIPFRNPTPTYRQVGKNARRAHAEMFLSDTREVLFSQDVRAGLIGQYSLDMPQKSFKVMAKAAFGERYLNASLFEDRPFDQYKSFVLRMGGNDAVWTRMVDGLQSRLIDQITDTTIINQAWRPVIVYLNGQYWGHYNLRERVSRYFAAQHNNYPLDDADNLTMIEGISSPYYGSNRGWRDLMAKVKNMDLANNPADLDYLDEHIDIDNLMDWMIFEMFFANTDSGNVRTYQLPGEKWRWIIYDMDYGLFSSRNNGVLNILNPKGHGANDDYDNTLFIKLLENQQMLDKFLRRFGEIFQYFTTERMLEQIDELYEILHPEMRLHWERWASHNLKNIAADQPQSPDAAMRYWESRVERLRNVARKRPRHCWVQVKDWFKLTDQQMLEYFGPKPAFPPESILDSYDNI